MIQTAATNLKATGEISGGISFRAVLSAYLAPVM